MVLWSVEAKTALDKVKQARKTLSLLQQRRGAKTQSSSLWKQMAAGFVRAGMQGNSRPPVFGNWTQTEEKVSLSYLYDRK